MADPQKSRDPSPGSLCLPRQLHKEMPDMDEIETITALFAANAEAIRIRDQEWREWWDRVAKAAGLRQSWFEKNMPPPDRK
jgi:hypothetical protein